MASCEVEPELWVNRFHQIKDQLVADNPSGIAQNIDQQARAIFMDTVYGPDVKSITQEWRREKNIPGPTYKVVPEGLTCLYAGKEIFLRELAVDNVKKQTPQNHNPKEEEILLSAERAILQSPTAEVVFPIYNKGGKIRYLSRWKRKDNFVETTMIDIAQDGQDKTLEEVIILMEQMAKEKKGRIKTDKQVGLSVGLAKAVEISLPTVLHRTVVNNIPVNPVLPESASLFSTPEQDSKKTVVAVTTTVAKPLFMPFQSVQPIQATPIMPAVEQTSMIPSQREPAISKIASIIEENSETASDNAKLEWAQVQKETAELVNDRVIPVVPSVSMLQNIYTKPLALEQKTASVFQPQALMVKEVVKESFTAVKTQTEHSAQIPISGLIYQQPAKETWQTKDAVACLDCHNQRVKVRAEKTVIRVIQAEQRPVFEKAVEELSLPFLEISVKTAPMMVIRAALKPVIQMAEQNTAFNLETDPMAVMESEKPAGEKIVLIDDQLQVPVEKKVIAEVDKEQSKLFSIENFSVVSLEAAETEKEQDSQIKKLIWMIKAPESKSGRASILELKLPCSPYAFLHFLQKVVKKVVGQDAIRTRQMTVIVEKEDVNFNLELIGEIEYYLELLRRKRNYAQAFAFVD